MTYPASGSQNQWGFYIPASTYEYSSDGGIPPATGALVPAQSPSGSVTNESATFNFAETITSTENYVSQITAARNDGTPFSDELPVNLVVDGKFDLETVPSGPGGSEGSEGSPQVNAPCSFNTLNPAIFQTFRWE
jgi:hypothetical protein